MSSLWIKNARVIDPKNKRDAKGDLFVADGKIVASLSAAQKKSAQTIDAKGLIACPGLVDIHVHFREPGQTHKESIKTGTMSAAAGGYTTVVCMGNTSPCCDNAGTIQLLQDIIKRDALINVHTTGCITVGMKGEALAPTGALKRVGVVALTDDGACVQNNEIMRRAVEYAKMHGLILMDHCQDENLTKGAVMNEGEWSIRLGLKGWPNAAEDIIVSRNVIIAESGDAHIHLQHISSARSVDIIRRAKQRGVKITAEASPHHIALTDECLRGYDTHFKMNPPLRTEHDRQALIKGLVDGTLDIIATDHAPHSPTEKDQEMDKAPFGITVLETALPICLEILVRGGHCDLPYLVALMTHKPADILGLPKGTLSEGTEADITLFDPEEKWIFDPKKCFSRSKNSPWNNQPLRGKIKSTFVAGRLVYDGQNIV